MVLSGVLVAAWLVALSVIDARRHRLPNALTLPGAVVIVAAAAGVGHGGAALAGGAALFGVYLAVHLASPAAMGAGDVKLALGLGALTGAFGVGAWLVAALGAQLLTVAGAVLIRRRVLPHGPAMCAAAALGVMLAI